MKLDILAFGAHPDDVEFGCFGTLFKHTTSGDNVYILVMTQSDVKDAYTDNITRNSKVSITEALNSSNLLGAELILGPFTDTNVPFNGESVSYIEKIIKEKNIDTFNKAWDSWVSSLNISPSNIDKPLNELLS